MMINILRKIFGKKRPKGKEQSNFSQPNKSNQITFNNLENPEQSFSIDLNNPEHVSRNEKAYKGDTSFSKALVTHIEPMALQKDSVIEQNIAPIRSISLSNPTVFTWQNRDAYIYQVASTSDGELPDLEFVVYIPIETAVSWLQNSMHKTPEHLMENANKNRDLEKARIENPDKTRHFGSEEDHHNQRATLITWKNNSKIDSSEDSDDEDDKNNKNAPKPKPLKEKKVKAPKMKKKKARQVITTYEEDEDEISLGRLRPIENEKQPIKIVGTKQLTS